ncbi:hypothetical protein QW180_28515 [Vibrio sinaloensis]|nr:hypothetical protein [Vibrio sinaloensis]
MVKFIGNVLYFLFLVLQNTTEDSGLCTNNKVSNALSFSSLPSNA